MASEIEIDDACNTMERAIHEIDKLRAEIKRLRAALAEIGRETRLRDGGEINQVARIARIVRHVTR